MVAGILHHLGVDMGPSRSPDAANPLGYFEDIRFRCLHRSWSRHYERRPVRARLRLPPWECTPEPTDMLRYIRLIRACEQRPCWGVKDPELCYYAAHFAATVNHPVRVIVTDRDTDTMITSLGAARRYFSPAECALIIREYSRRRLITLDELESHGIPPALWIDYDRAIDNPDDTVARIAAYVELPVTAAATAFIAPKLRRHRQSADTLRNDQGLTTLTT
jgi:hypothetical protein